MLVGFAAVFGVPGLLCECCCSLIMISWMGLVVGVRVDSAWG